jgi:hypothetical protein
MAAKALDPIALAVLCSLSAVFADERAPASGPVEGAPVIAFLKMPAHKGGVVAGVAGSGADYTVSVTGMIGSGNVVVSIPAGVAPDLSGNTNFASTSVDNTVTFGP